MEAVPLIALAAALAIFGLAKLSRDPRVRARRALARAKSVPIGDVKDGDWARVEGVVGATGPQMTSPVGRHECIGYRLEVQRADHDYRHVLTKEACGPFSITDDTGRVNVEGPFELVLDAEHDWSIVRQHGYEFLEAEGLETRGLLRQRRFAHREALLRPGDRVSVLGLAFLEPDPASPSSSFRAPLLIRRMRGSSDRPIVVADSD